MVSKERRIRQNMYFGMSYALKLRLSELFKEVQEIRQNIYWCTYITDSRYLFHIYHQGENTWCEVYGYGQAEKPSPHGYTWKSKWLLGNINHLETLLKDFEEDYL